jgi:threonylcarbamoyladenosine tRNA methylthiotransferase MtaB
MQQAVSACGFTVVAWHASADFRVINTCTVTAKTDRQCRHEIRRAKREHPACRVVVTGCFAQVSPAAASALPEADLVLGNLDKQNLAEHLRRLADQGSLSAASRVVVTPYASDTPFSRDFITHFTGYTRAFLKVQNGCDHRCAYCVIPAARGPSRSMRLADVLEQVKLLGDRGFREIVLTGIHVGAWGRDTGEGELPLLLSALAAEATRAERPLRFRLSSTEPMEITNGVIEVMHAAGDVFADHFHVPLQSGSDSVLARMNRPYRSRQYLERIESIRASFPDAAIGADVIVGFPGETDEEFEDTMSFVRCTPLTYLHVFSYSDRLDTAASRMPGKVVPEVIAERGLRLRSVGAGISAAHKSRLAGRVFPALVLRRREAEGDLLALTGNYQQVSLSDAGDSVNVFVRARLLRQREDGAWEGSCEPSRATALRTAP